MADSQTINSGDQWPDDSAKNSEIAHQALCTYIGPSVDYYRTIRQRLTASGLSGVTFNASCAIFGSAWAASRRLWVLCWIIAALDALALTAVGRAIWFDPTSVDTTLLLSGIGFFLIERLVSACLANPLLFRRFSRWRSNQSMEAGFSIVVAAAVSILILLMTALLVYRFSVPDVASYILKFPTDRDIALRSARAIDEFVLTLTVEFGAFFDAVTAIMRSILKGLKSLFIGTPWPIMAVLMLLASWRAGGIRVALFTAAAILYLGMFGFWDKAMDTLSLVAGSVLICVVVGTPIGIWSAKRARVNAVVTPILDLMQTMPSFVYLIPAIAFFSVGRTPAVIATVVFAMAPMIRLTALGISQVPAGVKESALAFGATPSQLLFKVELPLSLPSLMAGVNQAVMMSLSMVVIAALIGAGGLGFEVLFALQQVDAGKGLLSGLAIVVCAMVMDRIIQGSRNRKKPKPKARSTS